MRETFIRVACDLCGSSESREILRKGGRVTGEIFSIVRCTRCSLVYVNPRLSDERIASLYDDAYFRGEGFDPGARYTGEDDAHMRRSVSAILQSLQDALGTVRGKRILDVGCGGGSLVHALCDTGASARGIDSSSEAIRICRERSIPAIAGDLSSSELDGVRFDAITAIEVIEHVTSPTAFLERIRDLLEPGGIAFIGTGNWELVRRVRGTPYIMPEGHLYYFTPQTLRAYFAKVGFAEAPGVHRLWFVARAAARLRAEPLTWPLVRLAAAAVRFAAPQFGPFAIAQRSLR
jgi:2-polyprenyl-3-methyl-5-hydroxy-6-metoxy-1,4-benzoquinol methylase